MEKGPKPSPNDILRHRIQELRQKVGIVELRVDQIYERRAQRVLSGYEADEETEELIGVYKFAETVLNDARWVSALGEMGVFPEDILEVWDRKDEKARSASKLSREESF